MLTSRKKLVTIASSLLLACSLALVGATAAKSTHDGHNQADSAWGYTAVAAEDEGAVQEPAPTFPDEPAAIPLDSAWG